MERLVQWLERKYLRSKAQSLPEDWRQKINAKICDIQPRRLRGIPLNQIRFVVFDTETTGFHHKKGDEILSLGAVILEDGKIKEETFHRYINPHRTVPPVVSDLTGITQAQADAGEDAAVVIKDFLDFADICVLVGHSVDFDLAFLNHTLKKLGCRTLNQPSLDTYWLAQATYPSYGDLSLDGLVSLYQIESVGRHTALGDAALTAKVLLKLLSKFNKERFYDYIDLNNYIKSQNLQRQMTGCRHLGF